jgi:uncharacterized membrane protein YfhO
MVSLYLSPVKKSPQTPVQRNNLVKSMLVLTTIQLLMILVVFSKFLSGQAYFAYTDIGSDSIGQFVPYTMHLVRTLLGEGLTGWSFEVGLGGVPTLWFVDAFTWLTVAVGVENVLPARIFVYLLKLVLGGWSCLVLLRLVIERWQVAVVFALAYSFCGFITINGQWDPEATTFVVYPLVLWALLRTLRHGIKGNWWVLPSVVAVSLFAGVFFVALGVFILLVSTLFVICSEAPMLSVKRAFYVVAPLVGIGYLLAGPLLLPMALQMLDTSRVVGADSLILANIASGFTPNSVRVLMAELGGLFHKDLFGVGNLYTGYWNYLEGPGFYVGLLSLLLIPQLWGGSDLDRRFLAVGLTTLVLYFVFPIFRSMAMGFAAPYFRVSTLWVSLGLILMAARALDCVWMRRLDFKLLSIGAFTLASSLALVYFGPLSAGVWLPHLSKVVAFLGLSTFILVLMQRGAIPSRNVFPSILVLVALECLLFTGPSLVHGRSIVAPKTPLFDDGTAQALEIIARQDAGFYRVEKTFNTVSLADSLAQNYRGVKSYALHSKGMVDFFRGVGLIPLDDTVVNYTNWLPNMGERFMLNSLVGVKYVVSNKAVDWPGFGALPFQSPRPLTVYRNALALPLGIVQTQQLSESDFLRLTAATGSDTNSYKDMLLMNTAVVHELVAGPIPRFAVEDFIRNKGGSMSEFYDKPARALQKTGLQIESFSSNHIVGRIQPNLPGMLVFSIPFNNGWELRIDDVVQPMQRTNFGMLGCVVNAGAHRVELRFVLPGWRYGWMLALLGCVLLMVACKMSRRPRQKMLSA